MPDAQVLKVGDRVMVDSIEGFGGPGMITGVRDSPGGRYQVLLDDRSQPAFWAHDFEVSSTGSDSSRVDSRVVTYEHIQIVRDLLGRIIRDLLDRQQTHDRSKLVSPEVEVFDEFTPKLATSTYGSEEYRSFLAAMKPALDHHYAANAGHHPEGNPRGIQGMSLIDLTETLVDWLAASKRHKDGDIRKSIEINQERFGYSDELKQILLNTLPVLEP